MKGRVKTAQKNKKQKSKWNRIHEFQYKKATESTPRHPTYNFAKNKRAIKHLVFTTSDTTDGKKNIPLKYNIDETDSRTSYVRDGWFVANDNEFETVSNKKFRIHDDDKPLIKSLKNKKYKK